MKRRSFFVILIGALAQIPMSAIAASKKPTPKPVVKATTKPVVKTPTPTPTPTSAPASKATTIPAVAELPVTVDGKVILLGSISSPTSLYANVTKNGRDFPLLIAKPTERTIKVFTARCPHQGNILNLATKNEFQCDLHGARFDEATGKVLDGPTINNLESYEVIDRNGALYIKF